MKYIEVKGKNTEPVKLAYSDYGNGAPVVLIHGWPLSKEMWEYQLEPLVNAGFRVITYDRRGFGKSDKPWDGYDYDALAGDLKVILEQLDLQSVTLIGFSIGGGEIARYFSKYDGERVKKVILISSVLPCMSKGKNNAEGIPKEKFTEMLEHINNDRIGFIDEFGKQFFGINILNHPVGAPLLEYYRMLCSLASARATRECMKSFAFTDFTSDAAKINVPALLIHGDADRTVPIQNSSEKASRIIPDNKYIIYSGSPHGLFYTDKERLNDDLISFIKTGDVKEYKDETVLFPINEGMTGLAP